jgi:hypothetical protein
MHKDLRAGQGLAAEACLECDLRRGCSASAIEQVRCRQDGTPVE